ncbi:MAG: hypothetical protein HY000_10255 [Planctomycetes bacterium]|nr:hypothetical protein [Planctomycetota bacterium]
MRSIVWLMGLLAVPQGPVPEYAPDDQPRTLLVVSAPLYRPALEPWLQRRQRQRYRVELIDPAETIGDSRGPEVVERLREEIARHVPDGGGRAVHPNADAVPAAFVLLVGDAPGPTEPLDTRRLIPTAIQTEKARPSAPHRFASDNVYGLPDERGVPRLAVGRWPVRSPEEAAMQVRKSLRYETDQRPGLHRSTFTFLATTPNYDPVLDPVLEKVAMTMLGSQLGPHWGIRALYSSPRSEFFPGPEETARHVVRWLEDATPVTLFAGHGFDCGVDVVRFEGREFCVLDAQLATTIQGDRPGTLLWMSTCSCGAFALPPPERGLAESLMMNPRGPTAVVAGSDETSAYANTLLCLGLAQVIERPPDTLGQAVLRCKQALSQPGPGWLKKLLLSLEPTEKPDHLPEDHHH